MFPIPCVSVLSLPVFLLLDVRALQADVERREALLTVDDEGNSVGNLLVFRDFLVPVMDVVELVRVNAVLNVVLNEIVLELTIGEFAVNVPEDERADRVLTQD